MKSMTGYGKASQQTPLGTIEVEIKGVNHRFLNISYRSDHVFSSLEFPITQILQNSISRGSVRISIRFLPSSEVSLTELVFNKELARQYYEALCSIKESFSLSSTPSPGDFLQCPSLFSLKEKENSQLNEYLYQTVEQCLESFLKYREREGTQLQGHLKQILEKMSELTQSLLKESNDLLPLTLEKFKTRLEQFSRQIPQIPEERLVQEAVFLCDKADISEELARLEAHLEEIQGTFLEKGPVGRKLDFIAQECFREINTIASKVNQYSAIKHALELKSEVEKIREQIQNLE